MKVNKYAPQLTVFRGPTSKKRERIGKGEEEGGSR